MIAVLALVVMAQGCDAMLPPADARIEWFRNGRPYAVDQPAGGDGDERRYRRDLATGRSQTRVVSCARNGALIDNVAGSTTTIPLDLRSGSTRRVGAATVQRIQPPAGTTRGSTWFYISHLESQRVGVRAGIGIEEIQTLGKGSDVDVLFGRVVRAQAPAADSAGANALSAARERIRQLESQASGARGIEIRLRDSLAVLRRSSAAQPLVMDSLRVLSTDAAAARAALDTGIRMIADSARVLPSAYSAWNAALAWPGAGQMSLNRGGGGWVLIGGVAAATAVTALVLPAGVYRDAGLDADNTRRVAVGASVAVYAGALFYARSLLAGVIAEMNAAGVTREIFLRRASITVGPDGEVRVILRATR